MFEKAVLPNLFKTGVLQGMCGVTALKLSETLPSTIVQQPEEDNMTLFEYM